MCPVSQSPGLFVTQQVEEIVNLTRTQSNRCSSIQKAWCFCNVSKPGRPLMWLLLAVVAVSWAPAALRAGEAEDFFKFYSFYQSKW